jgi:hypothetical protein
MLDLHRPSDREHSLARIHADHRIRGQLAATLAQVFREGDCDISSAGSSIKNSVPRLQLKRLNHPPPPRVVQTSRDRRVDHVVAPGNLVEHLPRPHSRICR